MDSVQPAIDGHLVKLDDFTIDQVLVLDERDESVFGNSMRRIVQDLRERRDPIAAFNNYV